MSTDTLSPSQVDTAVIPEAEPTTPTPEALKAKADLYTPDLAGRRDGTEFVEIVYLADEGGYAVRRYSPDQSNLWRFMRTADFELAYISFVVVDMKKLTARSWNLIRAKNAWRQRFNTALNAMGKKSRQRLGMNIVDDLTKDN